MIGLCHLVAGDDSCMAGGESRMTGDCSRPEGSIHRCERMHSHLYSYIYGLVALLDNIQSSISSITIATILNIPAGKSATGEHIVHTDGLPLHESRGHRSISV